MLEAAGADVTPAQVERALELRVQGRSYRQIGDELDVAASTARRWVRKTEAEAPAHGHRWRLDWRVEGDLYGWTCKRCKEALPQGADTEDFLTTCTGGDDG